MSYRIIGDSSLDLMPEMLAYTQYKLVPFTISVEDYAVVDDDNINTKQLWEKIAESKECAKTACPSPDAYLQHFDETIDNIYVITISSPLSGSYNSAELARNLYWEERPTQNIAVIDSRSASGGMTVIAMKIEELEAKGLPFDEIVKEINTFRDELQTIFVLENLETLRKNGRLSKMQAVLAGALNIKPLLMADRTGQIVPLQKTRGLKKAHQKLIESIEGILPEGQKGITCILTHCEAPETAQWLRSEIEKRYDFDKVELGEMTGLSGTYANVGGIIMAFSTYIP